MITLFTYTHTNCMDLWEPYLDSLDKFLPEFSSVVVSNEDYEDHGRHRFQPYNETKNYCEEYVRCLKENVDTDHFIYMQEDFILYDRPNVEALKRYVSFLQNSSCSFVRLIRCGNVSNTRVTDDLYWITEPENHHIFENCFSMQPTIWNKNKFIQLYETTKRNTFGESGFIENMNRLKIHGVYAYNGEPIRKNSLHYDSSVFPYIATAIVKGKWNVSEYDVELESIFSRYEIDPSHRGVV